MQIERQQAVDARRLQQVRHEFGRDRDPRLHLAVLARVAVVGEHGRDAARRRAPHRVDHDQELHQRVVHRRARRLNQEHVGAAHVLVDLHVDLAVREARDFRVGHGHTQVLRDLFSESAIRVARDTEVVVSPYR